MRKKLKIKIGHKTVNFKDIPKELQARIQHELQKPPESCPSCGSKNITKHGKRHNLSGEVQVFRCSNCEKKITTYPKKQPKRTPAADTLTKKLRAQGQSLRNISGVLKVSGINVSHVAVYKWLKGAEQP